MAAAVLGPADTSAVSPLTPPTRRPPGSRAEQARGGPASHPEPVRNLPQRQQERERHAAGPLCGLVPGVLLAAGKEGKRRPARRRRHRPRRGAFAVGTRRPPVALGGRGGQESQETEAGAGQRENQEPAGVSEEEQRAGEELRLPGHFVRAPLLRLVVILDTQQVGLFSKAFGNCSCSAEHRTAVPNKDTGWCHRGRRVLILDRERAFLIIYLLCRR